ncbi:MAG TPA: protein kinase [Thermoanaerobaculia bacterium]|nr:protein kinase [Thermoanaerobaculia bacterium]
MSAASLAAGTAIGRYRIRDFLGSGGMGEVYLAWESSLEREVALKILPPALTSDAHRVERFVTEAKAASALNHPSIVTIYEIGEESSASLSARPIHYIAMERIEGVTLCEWMREDRPLGALLIQLASVAEGLAKAHERGIIHRDLKPENIMITVDGHAKVLDFGVAKLIESGCFSEEGASERSSRRTLTESTALLGTAGYMSPEQIEGQPLDRRADIFSFGCVLYECVTGRAPFAGSTTAETLHNVVHGEPAPVRIADPVLGASLQRIIDRCLHKEPDGRYDSARDVSLDLVDAARVATPARRRRRFFRIANPRLARWTGAVLGILLAGFLLTGLIDALGGTDSEVVRLQAALSTERERNDEVTRLLTARDEQLQRSEVQIERLREERGQAERLRSDLENSYRALLADVNRHLEKQSSERSDLKAQAAAAESKLRQFSEEIEKRTARQQTLNQLQNELGVLLEATIDPRGLVLMIPGELYGRGDRELNQIGKVLAARVASELARHHGLRIAVEGHADSSGRADDNLRISQGRADNVRDLLIEGGVPASSITAIGRGELFPAFSNETWQGRLRNRRVEIVVSP